MLPLKIVGPHAAGVGSSKAWGPDPPAYGEGAVSTGVGTKCGQIHHAKAVFRSRLEKENKGKKPKRSPKKG